MRLRPATTRDIAALLAQWNAHVPFDRCGMELFTEKTQGDPDFDAALWLVLEDEQGIAGWGFAVGRPATLRGHIKFLVLAPEHRGYGLGALLLDTLERRLRRRGVVEIRIDEAAPNYLNPGIDTRYGDAIRFFESRGYAPIGTAVHQRVALSGRDFSAREAIDALQSRGIHIRRAERADMPALESILSATWPAWISEVTRAMANEPVSVHLAWQGDRLIGFAAYDGNNLGTGWFGPMGTLPDARGRGIGMALLQQCLQDQQAQGHAYSIIPWVGPVDFYRKCVDAEAWRRFQRLAKEVT